MKKLLAVIMAVMLLCTITAGATEIAVTVNGEPIEFDVHPQFIGETLMVPMRFIFEKFGAVVMYDDETETVSAYIAGEDEDSTVIIIQINNPKAFINSSVLEMETAPIVVNDRTLVSLYLIENAFGCTAQWDAENNTITISKAAEKQPAEEQPAEEQPIEKQFDENQPDEDEFYEEQLFEDEFDEDEFDEEEFDEELFDEE